MTPNGAKTKTPPPNSQYSTFISVLARGLVRTRAAAGGRGEVTLVVQVRLTEQAVEDTLVGHRVVQLGDLGVVQVEGRSLGADPRDGLEVVPRRRAGGGPLQ